jgi:RNA polymerase sigma-70 factor (ECF subfamily)
MQRSRCPCLSTLIPQGNLQFYSPPPFAPHTRPMRYRETVGITPSQPAALASEASRHAARNVENQHPEQMQELHKLWQSANAKTYALSRSEFEAILLTAAHTQNYGQPRPTTPTPAQQTEFFANLKQLQLNDYVLAQSCAQGHGPAWEHFLALYRQPLTRAAIAITGSHSLGEDLADALYAELYGLTTRTAEDGDASTPVRKSPLASYKGRGSLIGWLRTTLAQRHIDHHRKTWREEPLTTSENPDKPASIEPAASVTEPLPSPEKLDQINRAVQQSLAHRPAEDRFLLAAYFLDQQTLIQISRILQVHEATVSRKLHRLLDELRKDLLTNLQSQGMSKRAAQEALGTDPRDLDIGDPHQLGSNLRNLLQTSQSQPFPEKAGQ